MSVPAQGDNGHLEGPSVHRAESGVVSWLSFPLLPAVMFCVLCLLLLSACILQGLPLALDDHSAPLSWCLIKFLCRGAE